MNLIIKKRQMHEEMHTENGPTTLINRKLWLIWEEDKYDWRRMISLEPDVSKDGLK